MPSIKAWPLKTEKPVEKQQLSRSTDDCDLKNEAFDGQLNLKLAESMCVCDHWNPHSDARIRAYVR